MTAARGRAPTVCQVLAEAHPGTRASLGPPASLGSFVVSLIHRQDTRAVGVKCELCGPPACRFLAVREPCASVSSSIKWDDSTTYLLGSLGKLHININTGKVLRTGLAGSEPLSCVTGANPPGLGFHIDSVVIGFPSSCDC